MTSVLVLSRLCDVLAYVTVMGVSLGLFLRAWRDWREYGEDGAFDFYAAVFFAFVAFGKALSMVLA